MQLSRLIVSPAARRPTLWLGSGPAHGRLLRLAATAPTYGGWLAAPALLPLLAPEFLGALAWPALAALLAALLSQAAAANRARLSAPYHVLTPALLLLLTWSLASALDHDVAWPKWTCAVAGLAAFWLAAQRWRERGPAVGCTLLALAGAAVVLAALAAGAWQPAKLFTLWPVYDNLPRLPQAWLARLDGGFHANELGAALALALSPAAALAGHTWARRSVARWGRAVALLNAMLLLAMLAVLALTQSRAAWLGAAAGLACLWALPRLRRALSASPARLPSGILAVAFVLAAGALLAWLAGRGGGLLAGATADSGATRLELWANALRLAADYPLLGAGLDMFPVVAWANYAFAWAPPGFPIHHTHSIYLQAAVDGGLVGLGLLLAFFVALARTARRVLAAAGAQQASLAAGLSGTLAAAMVTGLLDASSDPLGSRPAFLFWIAAAGIAASERALPAATAVGGEVRRWSPRPSVVAGVALAILALPAAGLNLANLAFDRAMLGAGARGQAVAGLLPFLDAGARLGMPWQSVRLGRAHLALGDEDAALAAWRRAPSQAATWLTSQGDVRWYRREVEQAERFYRLALAVDNRPPALYRLGRAVQTYDGQQAQRLYRLALAAPADLPPGEALDAWQRWAALAARDDPAAGLAVADRGLALYPQRSELLLARIDVSARMGDVDRETALLAAAAGGPAGLPVYRALAAYYREADRAEDMMLWAQRAMALSPGSAWPHIWQGKALLVMGQPGEAVRYLRRAAMLRPDLADPHIGLAAAHLALGDPRSAVAEAQAAVKAEPYQPEAHAALGDTLLAAGEEAAARLAYGRALALDAGDERARRGPAPPAAQHWGGSGR